MTVGLRRYRLVPVVAAAWATAAVTTTVPTTSGPIALASWGATLAALVSFAGWRRRRPIAVALVLAAAAAAVVASHVALAQPARTAAAELALDGGRALSVDASVVGKVQRRPQGELVFDVVTARIATGAQRSDVVLDIQVRVQPDDVDLLHALDIGAMIGVDGSARRSEPGNRAVITVRASRVSVTSPPSGLLALAGDLRRGLAAATRGLPAPGAGLVPGLAVGDTSGVDAALDAAMKASSLSHLTAVSGANCALVVGIAYAGAALSGARRGLRVAIGLAALGAFVVLVTPEPSVARASVMAAVAMLAVALGRPAVGTAVLSLAVTLLLIGDPWLSASLGFALSATATASLLLLARPLAGGLARWMPRSLALALSIPLAAQLACGPLLVLIDPTVPLFGVVANLLAAPAAPAATVIGLAACLALPIPLLQSGLAALAWAPASWVAATAGIFAAIPGGRLAWLDGWPGAVILAMLGGAVAVLLAVRRGRTAARIRAAAGLLMSCIVGVSAGAAGLASIAGPLTLPPVWAILACDVGQGDAVLIRSSERVALIDTGPEPEPLSACLARAGVARIDLLVLTHFDLDHVGGVGAVVGRVDDVAHGPPTSAADESLLDALADGGAEVRQIHAGDRGHIGEADWSALWPRERSRAFPGGNDASVVIEVHGGGVPDALFLGDLSTSPQGVLEASADLAADYDVVKVAHHGSADQDPDLYRSIDPVVALVTVGAENDYGHPRAEILQVLDDLGATIARTDLDGMVALWSTSSGLAVWRERVGPAG